MFSLCDDLLFEVLLSLPVTTLLQSKLVCREWHALIASPLLVGNHHARAMSQPPGIILTQQRVRKKYIEPTTDATVPSRSCTISALPPTPTRLTVASGFCCGLVCYYDTVECLSIVVANPITCEYLRLPRLPENPERVYSWNPYSLRMGFDHVTGTYKVLADLKDRRSLLIIALGDCHWRRVEYPAPELRCYFHARTPSYQWLRWTSDEYPQASLLFDVVSETFRCWSEVGPSKLCDSTGASLGPQYVVLEQFPTLPYSTDQKLHDWKICRGGNYTPMLCYANYTSSLCPRLAFLLFPGATFSLSPGDKNETYTYACFHQASLVSPKEMARSRTCEFGINGCRTLEADHGTMVRFQCEDCGEELTKPKLPNHFRFCSAVKLSCLDCRVIFTQETVQGHRRCITQAEKYSPKGDAKSPHTESESEKNADVDSHVGLSAHAPWFRGLCNAHAPSRQTLLTKESSSTAEIGNGNMESKNREQNPTTEGKCKVAQADDAKKSQKSSNKQKVADSISKNAHSTDKNVASKRSRRKKMKKPASSILRSNI